MELAEKYPAVFAKTPAPTVSTKYQFIPTTDIISLMEEHDFHVRDIRQMGTRNRDPNYVKHAIRFRHKNPREIHGAVPEILVSNSHDTSAGLAARGGLYRFACTNGLVVGQDLYRLSVPHVGDAKAVVAKAIEHMLTAVFPRVQTQVERWLSIQLEHAEKIRLAVKAMELRYTQSTAYYGPEKLLEYRRPEDSGDDLWTVFNVIQENITQGGIQAASFGSGRMTTSKRVEAIDANIRINAGLWDEAEKLAREVENA